MDAPSPGTTRSLRLIARVVPRGARDEWLAEWAAESVARRPATSWGRARRLGDAFEDAARLRWRSRSERATTLAAVGQDLRYALRALRARPAYVVAACIALGLGLGVNTAIFSVVNGVLFHRLPYADPDELVVIWSDGSRRGLAFRAGAPPADYLRWRDSNESFVDMATLANSNLGTFTELDLPLSPLTHVVTPNYFDVLGVSPWLGRAFTPADAGSGQSIIVSHDIWRQVLESDEQAIGREVVLDDRAYVVIGVMPAGFYTTHQLPVQPGIWIATDFAGREDDLTTRTNLLYARLRPGVSVQQAQDEMAALAVRAEESFPDSHAGWGLTVVPIQDNAVGAYRQTFSFLVMAVGLVLLIACANVANLGLAHAVERAPEMALRAALGGQRSRLIRQTLLESLVLAIVGGALGAFLAWSSLPLLMRMIPGAGNGGSSSVGGTAAVPFLEHVAIDGTVLGFALLAALATGVLAGTVPARRAGRRDLAASISAGGRSGAETASTGRLRGLLVIAETAIALVLLFGAGLLLQSFANISAASVGFDVAHTLTMRNSLRGEPDQRAWVSHFEQAAAALEALPGVRAASAASFAPPEFANANARFHRPGDIVDPETDPSVTVRVVLPRYFEALGIDVVAGRPIDERDGSDSAPVVVINERMRRLLFDGAAVGERIVPDLTGTASTMRRLRATEWEVVGVVDNVRGAGNDPQPHPIVYVPAAQFPMPIMNLVARTTGPPEALLRDAEKAVWGLGNRMNVYNVETLQARLGNLQWQSRFAMQLLLAFALLALVLGAAGLYAVLKHAVSKRTREMGVRVALGASRAAVLRLVIGDGLRLTLVGVLVGAVASVALARVLSGLLYGIDAVDLSTLAFVTVALLVVAFVACLTPALRATRVDPATALRN